MTAGRRIERRLARALPALHIEPADVTPLAGNPPWRIDTRTFMVTTTAGEVVKVRVLGSTRRAERMMTITAALADPRLPAPVARLGDITVERWIEGTTLSDLPLADAHIDEAARLLATVHAFAGDGGPPPRRSVAQLRSRALAQVAELADGGPITRADATQASEILANGLPARADWGVIHTDLCADNLVVRRDGALACIDNEFMMRGYRELGLARTWYRWPMPGAAWSRFEHAYRSALGQTVVPTADEACAWRVAATVKGVHLRHRRGAVLDHAVASLRQLTAGR